MQMRSFTHRGMAMPTAARWLIRFMAAALLLGGVMGWTMRASLADSQSPHTEVTLAAAVDTYVASGRPNEGNATYRTLWVGHNETGRDCYLDANPNVNSDAQPD